MRDKKKKKHKTLQQTLCCNCRYTTSSESSSDTSERFATNISRLAHALVQERLDQMINERREAKRLLERRRRSGSTKFVVMVAVEKSSYDPTEDFRDSMVEMITSNKIEETKDLRRLLNYYVSMNSEEYRGVILEVFHDVCTKLFSRCKFRF